MINNNFCLLIHWRNPFIVSAGSEKYIQVQVAELEKNNIDTIVVFPVRKKIGITIFGWGMIVNKKFIGVYDEKIIIKLLHEALARHSCKGVMVHHLMWCNLQSLQKILSFSPEIIFYVHDYYSCCEQENLLKNNEYYCGDGALKDEKCGDCSFYKISIDKKEATKKFLASFEKIAVVAPSEIAAKIWADGYPKYTGNIKVIEHLSVREHARKTHPHSNDKLNVAFVGTGKKSKGWNLWIDTIKELPDDIRNRYNFYHLGFAPEENAYVKYIPVSIADDGPNAMVDALQKYNIDVAMLLSLWPETYCYTFFEALQCGCYVVTTELSGNIQKQVNIYKNGTIIKPSNQALRELLANPDEFHKLCVDYKKRMFNQEYEVSYNKDYLQLLADIPIAVSLDEAKSINFNKSFIADILYRLRYREVL